MVVRVCPNNKIRLRSPQSKDTMLVSCSKVATVVLSSLVILKDAAQGRLRGRVVCLVEDDTAVMLRGVVVVREIKEAPRYATLS